MMAKMANIALVALTLVAGGLAESKFFSEFLADGTEVELLSHGPFTISAECGSDGDGPGVRMLLTVTADRYADEWVYGYPDYVVEDSYDSCVGTTVAGTVSRTCLVWETGSGKGLPDDAGAYTSLSGYYVAFGGSTTIGFNKEYLSDAQNLIVSNGFSAGDVAAFPADCAISGELVFTAYDDDDWSLSYMF